MQFSDSRSSQATIQARLTLEDGSRISGEVINFLKEGAALLFSSPKSLTPLLGAGGTATFSVNSNHLLTTSATIEHIIDEGLMQMCSIRFTELQELSAATESEHGDEIRGTVSGNVRWKNRDGLQSVATSIKVLNSGKIELDDTSAGAALELDTVECEATLEFPEPIGRLEITMRRQLTNEPCTHVFLARSGATCLATQLISLWAFKSILGAHSAAMAIV